MAPERIVLVEMVWMQYQYDDVFALLHARFHERPLGGSLTLTWPDPALPSDPQGIPFASQAMQALNAVFDEARAWPSALAGRSHVEDGWFEACLNYTDGVHTRSAFLHRPAGPRAGRPPVGPRPDRPAPGGLTRPRGPISRARRRSADDKLPQPGARAVPG